jgi:hypothetical protein
MQFFWRKTVRYPLSFSLLLAGATVLAAPANVAPLVGKWSCVAKTPAAAASGTDIVQTYSAVVAPDGSASIDSVDVFTSNLMGQKIPVTIVYQSQSKLRLEGRTMYSTPVSINITSSTVSPQDQTKLEKLDAKITEARQQNKPVDEKLGDAMASNYPDVLRRIVDRSVRRAAKDQRETAVPLDVLESNRWQAQLRDANGKPTTEVACQRVV